MNNNQIYLDELFVACQVYDYEVVTEPYEHYETFGEVEHRIIVNPERKLVIKKLGSSEYRNPRTGVCLIEREYTSSFKTDAAGDVGFYNMPICMGPLERNRRAYFKRKQREIQFIIPFKEFVASRLGEKLTNALLGNRKTISLTIANALIAILNQRELGQFTLSFDPEVAKRQIEVSIYHNEPSLTMK